MQTQLKKAGESMDRRLEHMRTEFSEIRAGRANPAVLDKVKVDYYGAPTPVNQLAAVSVTEARTLTIQPWDASVLRQIDKAIQTSDIGINPQNDGKIIRLIFPPLTEDRRKEIVKDVQKIAEETKIQIRNVRRELIDKLKAMTRPSMMGKLKLLSAPSALPAPVNRPMGTAPILPGLIQSPDLQMAMIRTSLISMVSRVEAITKPI